MEWPIEISILSTENAPVIAHAHRPTGWQVYRGASSQWHLFFSKKSFLEESDWPSGWDAYVPPGTCGFNFQPLAPVP